MSTLYIPYALGNLRRFSFKEITKKEYDIFLGALAEQDRIYKAKQQEQDREKAIITEKRKKFRDSIPTLKQSYINAQKDLDNFRSLHRDVFSEYDRLTDDDYNKLSWLFGFSSRERELNEHKSRYKHIHDQLKALAKRAHSLSRYSEDNMAATSSSTENSYDELYSKACENIAKKWDTGLQTQQQLLYPTRGYYLLIENLQINTSGVLVEIIGNGIQLFPSRRHQQIRQSLLNQNVQIIR
ncbi:MAG: hypothetical protein R8N50_03670 [Alphaproteobacteria bacterium]|nr:hypothetical protein [Alphaproteobacteria bacterium]